jgi:hypothetical protein
VGQKRWIDWYRDYIKTAKTFLASKFAEERAIMRQEHVSRAKLDVCCLMDKAVNTKRISDGIAQLRTKTKMDVTIY